MSTVETAVKTRTAAIFPILIALDKFKELGIDRFVARGHDAENQILLLNLLPEARNVQYDEKDIVSFASRDIAELNKILKEKGFDIQLSESQDSELGVVTIMDLVAPWLAQALKTEVSYEGQQYPAMLVNTGASLVGNTLDKELLMIRTKNGINIFIEKAEHELSGIDLFMYAMNVSKSLLYNE